MKAHAVGVSHRTSSGGLLTQIQALRAVAVLLVVAYHLFPSRLPGGYVGVDIFFVISGFLMTKHILRGTESGRSLGAGLNDFYIRRIRRILPASLLVLFVCAVVTLVGVSKIKWDLFLSEISAGAFYFENWALAAGSTDYLAAGVGASPVQHFWSLSVEEQFYLAWPLLLIIAATSIRWSRPSRAVRVLICVLVVVSFAYSVVSTLSDAKFAYFDLFARLWEFGLGGALAVFPRLNVTRRVLAGPLGWLGLAVIAFCALAYSGETAFPGWAAAAPVAATVLLIASGERSAWWGPQRLFKWRPVQYIGDISYSLYLWHWPLIILVPAVSGDKLSTVSKIVVAAAAVALAAASKRFVEDRFRRGVRRSGRRTGARAPYVGAVIGMVVVGAVAGGGWYSVQPAISQARQQLVATQDSTPACFGAMTLESDQSTCSPAIVSLRQVVPSPLIATEDGIGEGCQQRVSRSGVIVCTFGNADAQTRIALVGDSHATQWLPALIANAKARDWRIDTYLMSGCVYSVNSPISAQCREWNQSVREHLVAKSYSFVLVSGRSAVAGGPKVSSLAKDIATAWADLETNGRTKVIAIRDIPQPDAAGSGNIPDCVYDNPNSTRCGFTFKKGQQQDLMTAAAARAPSAQVVDLTRYFCQSSVCPAVIGKVLVYLDDNHMTATYSRSLAVPLASQLFAAGLK